MLSTNTADASQWLCSGEKHLSLYAVLFDLCDDLISVQQVRDQGVKLIEFRLHYLPAGLARLRGVTPDARSPL